MEKALLGDDGADQEGDQHHDRDRLKTDPVELIGQRRQPQRSWPAQHIGERQEHRAEHLEEYGQFPRRVDRGAAKLADFGKQRIRRRRRGHGVAIDLADLLDQSGIIIGDAGHLGAMAVGGRPPRHFLDQPGADRIELANLGQIDLDVLRLGKRCCHGIGERLERRCVGRGPGSGRTQFKRVAGRQGRQQGCHRQGLHSLCKANG